MNSFASHRALQSAQALYDAMEDDSWEDGDPLASVIDELIADANRCRELVEKGEHEKAFDLFVECQRNAKYGADLVTMRMD